MLTAGPVRRFLWADPGCPDQPLVAGAAFVFAGVFYACNLGGSPLNSATLYSGWPGLPRRHPFFYAFGAAHAVSGTPTSDRYSGTDRQGDGKGRLFRSPLFVEGLLPGEQALVEVDRGQTELSARQAGRADPALRRRVADFCPNTECGGCQVRPLAYPAQLKLKQSLVQSALEQVGLGDPWSTPSSAWRRPFAYRNKAQYAVRGGDAGTEIGFYRKHSMTSSPPTTARCRTPARGLNARVRNWMREHDIAAYDDGWPTPAACATLMTRGFKAAS